MASLYEVITGTLSAYISEKNQLQKDNGYKRAILLQDLVDLLKDNDNELEQLIELYTKSSTFELSLDNFKFQDIILSTLKSNENHVFSNPLGSRINHCKTNYDKSLIILKELQKGKTSPTSLKPIISKTLNEYYKPKRKNAFDFDNMSDLPMAPLSPFEQIENENTYVYYQDLELVGSAMVKSAHAVERYRYNDDIYFVKLLDEQLNQEEKDYEIECYLAEIVYCKFWQYFIGAKASSSALVLDLDNHVIGISSKGLKDFKPYAQIDPQSETYSNLIPLLIFMYLLVENDAHINNYGAASIYDRQQDTLIKSYAKIDHDYLISQWNQNSQEDLAQMYPLKPLAEIIANGFDPKNTFILLKELLSNLRFSPLTANSRLLQFGHQTREKLTGQEAATTSKLAAKTFALTLSNSQNIDDFRQLCITLPKLFNKNKVLKLSKQMDSILDQFPEQYHTKARDIIKFIGNRMLELNQQLKATKQQLREKDAIEILEDYEEDISFIFLNHEGPEEEKKSFSMQ
ncbi:MAG: hypothetical protein EP298_12850 [Gammaproteobacteria bacterium]|nr:MAG: hypothetical protein EP298_12850 [Gammaproteobacteria bacterium]UTW42787.1 hypothetical protein KFE69_01165 [bacterium SCSIO 12844]